VNKSLLSDKIQGPSRTLSIKLDCNTLTKIDYLIKYYKFRSRSEFIRNAIMYKINQLNKDSKYSQVL
jgi:metal-responsive CopG/Arc/MetJ family transcriptional regulator